MGFYVDWLSIAGLSKDEVFERLGLVDTGVATDFPKSNGFMWAVSPDGRVIIVTGRYGLYQPAMLAELSAGASVVAARAESNECTSSAWGYEDGKKIWTVEYNDDTHPDVKMRGRIPAAFKEIRDRLLSKHASDEDKDAPYLFDGPSELAAILGGWAPENSIADDLEFFTARPKRKLAGDTTSTDGTPRFVFALFFAQLIMVAKFVILGPGIYNIGSNIDYLFTAFFGILSGSAIWIMRNGILESVTAFLFGPLMLILYGSQIIFLFLGLHSGRAYTPVALPVLIALTMFAVYEFLRLIRSS